ncbi:MAG: tyrosine-type recombinase/integrase [Betaproteobacteria bacterium]|nr:tyrosine-type recombinase/integrase [Betaproteobacteria bacterium]
MAILTDTKARSIKPGQKPLPHGGVTGLTLHPSSRPGQGKWVFRFVSPVTGTRRNMGLGTYPAVGIANAAKQAAALREDLLGGNDPLEKKKLVVEAAHIPTFEEAARSVHETLLPGWKNKKHQKQWINTLNCYALPIIGHIPVNEITPAHLAEALRPIWLDIPETASRVKQRLHAVMAWCWAHGHCSSNPVDVVTHLLPQQPERSIRTKHHPAMPWRDIPRFVNTFMRPEFGDVTRPLLEFVIHTGCRSEEVRGMVWSEVNMENATWTIPPERMKNKIQHRVPLTERTLEILRSLQGWHDHWVFPSPRDQVQLSDMVLTSFLRRVKARSSDPNRVATAHGFRSSFRDWASENGYSRDLAERALAHSIPNKVEAAYHRTDLLEQRRSMMEQWSKFICSGDR